MSKISFTNLNTRLNTEVRLIEFNHQTIEVKQYLPINDKLTLIQNVINKADSADMNPFINEVKINVFLVLEILTYYTNIEFTEEAPEKLYDLVVSSGLYDAIWEVIPEQELKSIDTGLWSTITNMHKYQYSVLGIMESMSKDYSNLDFDIQKLTDKLSNPEELGLVKDIITKLG